MDQDGTLTISFDEWRDFLLLAPTTNIHDLIKFWRHSTVSDFLLFSQRVEIRLWITSSDRQSNYVVFATTADL